MDGNIVGYDNMRSIANDMIQVTFSETLQI